MTDSSTPSMTDSPALSRQWGCIHPAVLEASLIAFGGALLLWALALPAGTQAQSNPDFELAENGVTVLCDDAEVGDTGEVNGTVYTKRTRSQINDQNAATTCTSGITNLGTLFRFNDSFNEDISTWDVSSATSLNSLFLRAESFNQDLSNWDVSNVTNMRGMFDGAESFDQDLSSWDTGNVEDMRNMFRDAESFDQDLSNWDVSGVVEDGGSFDNTMEGMFDGSGLSNNNYDALLIGWAQLDLQDDITLGASGIQYGPDAVEARQSIIDDYNWTINDGGFTGINFELASNDVTVLCEDADAGDVGEVEGVLYTKRNVEDIDTDNAATTCTSGITDMSELFEGETTFNEDISRSSPDCCVIGVLPDLHIRRQQPLVVASTSSRPPERPAPCPADASTRRTRP